MSYTDNKELVQQASKIIHKQLQELFLCAKRSYPGDLWNELLAEDNKQSKIENQILKKDQTALSQLDIQALQKILCFREETMKNVFMKAFNNELITKEFKEWIRSGIKCRNAYSHTDVQESEFTDEFTETHLVNYRHISAFLLRYCPETRSLNEEYEKLVGPVISKFSPYKTIDICELCEHELSPYSIVEVAEACVSCGIELTNYNKSIKSSTLKSDIIRLKEQLSLRTSPRPRLKHSIPAKLHNFVGRNDLMEEIDRKLSSSENHMAVITGMGGMGKSCAAIRYAHENSAKYNSIQYVFFEKHLRKTVLKLDFDGMLDDDLEASDEDKYQERMKYLKEYGKNTLLIIDNMDTDNEEKFLDLQQLSCDIIITTRCKLPCSKDCVIKIQALSDEEQIQLFKFHYFDGDADEELSDDEMNSLKELLNLIEGHTLLIELSAKAIHNGNLEFFNITEYLLGNTEIDDLIDATKDIRHSQDTLDGFINKLFDVAQLNDNEKNVLSLLFFIPLSGIEQGIFSQLAGLHDNNSINSLKNKSWLYADSSRKNPNIHIHPMIAKAVSNRIPPTYEKSESFINKLLEMLSANDNSDKTALCAIAKNVVMNLNFITEEQYFVGIKLQRHVFEHILYKDAKDMLKSLAETINERAMPCAATVMHEQLGLVYENIGDYDKAIENCSIALKKYHISKDVSKYFTYGHLMNKIGFLYRKKSDYIKSEYWYKKALYWLEEAVEKNCDVISDLATTYNDLGILYLNKGKFEEAKEYYERGLNLRNEMEPKDYDAIAYSYHNIGTAYQKLDNYTEAIRFHEKALDIRRSVVHYSEKHPLIASSLTMLANDYTSVGEYEKAYTLYIQALENRLRCYGEIHPSVAWSYSSLSEWYEKQHQYSEAKDYMRKCIRIREEKLGKEHKYTQKAYEALEKITNEEQTYNSYERFTE